MFEPSFPLHAAALRELLKNVLLLRIFSDTLCGENGAPQYNYLEKLAAKQSFVGKMEETLLGSPYFNIHLVG